MSERPARLQNLSGAAYWMKIRSMFTHALRLLLAAGLLTLLAACPPLDLGAAPFLCNNGLPKCPLGYECKSDICVKDGTAPPKLDGGKDQAASDKLTGEGLIPQDMNHTDAEGGTTQPDKGVAAIKILISEFMADPDVSSDDLGEWIELYNPSSQIININGWTLKDTQTDVHKLKNSGPLFVPAKGYLVLGRTTNTTDNGGTPVAYAYDNFFLSNSTDEIILLNEKSQVVDSFTYNTITGYNITAGSSLSIKTPGSDPTQASSWCVETSPWTGSKGDKGTPLANPKCN